jgi:hypothetical protein
VSKGKLSAGAADAPVTLDEPEIEGRYAELGDYTVAFETHKADMDPAPLFQGLPEDRCQCPHWGVVLSGRIVFRYADRDEVYTAGDAYYGARQYQQHRRPRPAGLTRWIRLIRWIGAPGGYRIHRVSHFHRISAPRRRISGRLRHALPARDAAGQGAARPPGRPSRRNAPV